jgi:hypothetical protein
LQFARDGEMLRKLVECGKSHAISTTHFNELSRLHKRIEERLKEKNINV